MERNGKGFVLSFSTLLIVSVLVLFAVFYSGKVERSEQSVLEGFAVEKAGFVADDVEGDLNKLLGASVVVNRNGDSVVVRVHDLQPRIIGGAGLEEWGAFVEGDYAARQNAEIVLGLSALADGKTELVFSNGLQYDHQYSGDQNFVGFYRSGGADTGVTGFDINVYVDGAGYDAGNSSAWSCDDDGDVSVNLYYSDSFGQSFSSECRQDSGWEYEYEIALQGAGGGIVVSFGDVQGNENSVKVWNNLGDAGIVVASTISAEFPVAGGLHWHYDADLNYSQGDVNIGRKIGFGVVG